MTIILQNFERVTSQARLGSRINPPENILYTTMRSPRRRRLRKECRLSRRSHSSYGNRRKFFRSLVAKRWICSKQSVSETRFDEQACIAYSRWGQTNVFERETNVETDNLVNNRLTIVLWRQPLCNGWRVRRNCP